MKNKIFALTFTVLIQLASVNSFAANLVWQNGLGSGDHLWRTPGNWDTGALPTSSDRVDMYDGNELGDVPSGRGYCMIDSGTARTTRLMLNAATGTTSTQGAVLKMTGGTLDMSTATANISFGEIANMVTPARFEMSGGAVTLASNRIIQIGYYGGAKGIVTLSNNADFVGGYRLNIGISGQGSFILRNNAHFQLTGTNGVYLGTNTGGQGQLIVEGGLFETGTTYLTVASAGSLGATGHIELSGGKIKAAGLSMYPDPSKASINISGGVLELTGNVTSIVQNFIDMGCITAHSGRAAVINVYNSSLGVTQISAPPVGTVNYLQAGVLKPMDAAEYAKSAATTLKWSAGNGAQRHLIYLGTDSTAVANDIPLAGDIDRNGNVDFNDFALLVSSWLSSTVGVNPNPDLTGESFVDFADFAKVANQWQMQNATFIGSTAIGTESFVPGILEPGQTYYWRVDEVGVSTITVGAVWSFTVDPFDVRLANTPSPADFGEGKGNQNITLSWTAGTNMVSQDVYFSTVLSDVDAADNTWPVGSVYRGPVSGTTYNAGNLTLGATYYWRVDTSDGGVLRKGRIWSFTAVPYGLDFGVKKPDHLYALAYDVPSPVRTEVVALGALQGIVAQTMPELFLYKTNGEGQDWLGEFRKYGVDIIWVETLRGSQNNLEWALTHFSSQLTGYILYDSTSNPNSLNIASSLAGILGAVPIDVTLQTRVQALGGKWSTPVLDVTNGTTYTNTWLRTNYFDTNLMTKKAVVSRGTDMTSWFTPTLHDFVSVTKSMLLWDSSTAITDPIYNGIVDNSPVMGNGTAVYPDNELKSVDYAAGKGLYTTPSDGTLNFSAYMGMAAMEPRIQFTQKARVSSYPPETGKHYVTFIQSDMDNIYFTIKGFQNDLNSYGNPNRGTFAYGWGMAPTMFKFAPHVAKWWYDNATTNDCFIVPFSGMGYTSAEKLPGSAADAFMAQTNRFMQEGDLRAVWLVDNSNNFYSDTTLRGRYASMSAARGFFVSGNPYNQYGKSSANISWTNGKPLIAVRDCLWIGLSSGDTPASLITKLNGRSRTVTSADAYSPVILHIWSYGFNDVKTVVDGLNSNVRVITPEEMIERIYTNISH